jgi:hypothetical protein
VLEFDEEDARQAGQICAHLASKGTPIATGAVARPAEYSYEACRAVRRTTVRSASGLWP